MLCATLMYSRVMSFTLYQASNYASCLLVCMYNIFQVQVLRYLFIVYVLSWHSIYHVHTRWISLLDNLVRFIGLQLTLTMQVCSFCHLGCIPYFQTPLHEHVARTTLPTHILYNKFCHIQASRHVKIVLVLPSSSRSHNKSHNMLVWWSSTPNKLSIVKTVTSSFYMTSSTDILYNKCATNVLWWSAMHQDHVSVAVSHGCSNRDYNSSLNVLITLRVRQLTRNVHGHIHRTDHRELLKVIEFTPLEQRYYFWYQS